MNKILLLVAISIFGHGADSVLVGQVKYYDIPATGQDSKDNSYCVIDSGKRHQMSLIIIKSDKVDLKLLNGKYCRLNGNISVYDFGIKEFSVAGFQVRGQE